MSEKATTNVEMPEFEYQCNVNGCIIVERVAGAVVIRDSKNPYQPGLVFSRREYADFRRRVRNGPALRLRRLASWLGMMLAQGTRDLLRSMLS
ncbi:DUF397 domain-containing protein [Spirillospora sp. CA-255316]